VFLAQGDGVVLTALGVSFAYRYFFEDLGCVFLFKPRKINYHP
jgi:hypothetical protein